jgi:hypothetical protein
MREVGTGEESRRRAASGGSGRLWSQAQAPGLPGTLLSPCSLLNRTQPFRLPVAASGPPAASWFRPEALTWLGERASPALAL